MKYLIWRSPYLEINLYNFNKLNNLGDLILTPKLHQWVTLYQLKYPNAQGTQQWSDPIVCTNEESEYYNAVAMPILDAVYAGLTSDLISDLQQLGVSLPDEGITQAIEELPGDWNGPIA